MKLVAREIPFGRPIIGEEEREAVQKVLDSPILVHGPRAKEFEAAFGGYTGSAHNVSVSSCTAGLHLAYFYQNIKPGDEVIVPAQTHVATVHAVELCGGRPVFVDAEPATGNVNIDAIEALITPRTRAISIVHFLGIPVAMDRVCAIAKKHNLFVVEDCALAIGTRYRGVHAGLWGDLGAFSFYPVKHITTAEGGMVITRRPEVAAALTRQKAFGVDRTVSERSVPGVYDVTHLGFNYRMNEIEAAIGIEQVKRIPWILKRRTENFMALRKACADISQIRFLETSDPHAESSHYCATIVLDDAWRERRLEIVRRLNAAGVGTSVYYPRPVPHFSYYVQKYGDPGPQSFPEASRISYGSIALPVGPHLGVEDMLYIAQTLKETIAGVK